MATLFQLPKTVPLSGTTTYPGAKAYFYQAGTTTPITTYTTAALSVPHANPVVADANGVFAPIFLNEGTNPTYKLRLNTSSDVLIYEVDNIPTALNQQNLGAVLWPRTDAERDAGVTPTNYAYEPGYRARYLTLADQIAVSATHPAFIKDDETISSAITIPSGAQIYGIGRPQITNNTAGSHIFGGVSLSNVIIDGIRFVGANSSTTPSTTFTGGAATDTGLVTLNLCTDVRITNCEFSTFYNGFCAIRSTRMWFTGNYVHNWKLFGLQLAEAAQFTVDHNVISGSDGGASFESYGVHATGDKTNSHESTANSISFNVISDNPAWSGIMTHEVNGLRIIGNDIRNVRQGLDIGASGPTPDLRNLVIANNYIKSATTDSWGGSAAGIRGILVNGKNSTYPINNATITGNIVDGFFGISGSVSSGDTAHIVVSYADKVTITGNTIVSGGSVVQSAGILCAGDTLNNLTISGNSMQGTFASGGIRLSSLIAGVVAITGNTVRHGTTSHNGVFISGSTITSLALSGNATNSDAGSEFLFSTSTLGLEATDFYSGSATFDPSNLADGAGETTTVTCTGAALGDFATASFSLDLQGITLTSWVSATNTVSVRFQNESGGAVDLASGTLRVKVRPA